MPQISPTFNALPFCTSIEFLLLQLLTSNAIPTTPPDNHYKENLRLKSKRSVDLVGIKFIRIFLIKHTHLFAGMFFFESRKIFKYFYYCRRLFRTFCTARRKNSVNSVFFGTADDIIVTVNASIFFPTVWEKCLSNCL